MTTYRPTERDSYILRCWIETAEDDRPVRRFSFENALTGERHGFGSVEALLIHLARTLPGAHRSRGPVVLR